MNEILPSSEILKQNSDGKTRLVFTKKSLFHILQQHSESHGTQEARQIGKICFRDQQEIENIADVILNELTSEIEYERACGIHIHYDSRFPNQISYRPFERDLMVQLKPIGKNVFEIVSFYKNKYLKGHSSNKK